MNQFKRAQVIMLSTQLNTCNLVPIIKYINDKLHYLNMEFTNNSIIDQHLYIISDDKIEEGDLHIESDHSGFGFRKYKIIATTDTSLKIFAGKGDICDLYYNLPQPSQQFIEKYIESYNKGEVITDVLVEYESKFETIQEGLSGFPEDNISWWNNKIKVNPKDNTIVIKKIKDSWNREEVIELIYKYCNEMTQCISEEDDKWIEENL